MLTLCWFSSFFGKHISHVWQWKNLSLPPTLHIPEKVRYKNCHQTLNIIGLKCNNNYHILHSGTAFYLHRQSTCTFHKNTAKQNQGFFTWKKKEKKKSMIIYLSKEDTTIGTVLLNWLFCFTQWTHNFIHIFSVKGVFLLLIMTKTASINFVTAWCLQNKIII
jgi:hypothetical protein